NRPGADHHAFDQTEGITLHDHPIAIGAGIPFVGIRHDILLLRPGLLRDLPLFPYRERRSSATSQSRDAQLFDDRLRRQTLGRSQSFESASRLIFIEREWLGDTEIGEGETALLLQKRYSCHRSPAHAPH